MAENEIKTNEQETQKPEEKKSGNLLAAVGVTAILGLAVGATMEFGWRAADAVCDAAGGMKDKFLDVLDEHKEKKAEKKAAKQAKLEEKKAKEEERRAERKAKREAKKKTSSEEEEVEE